MNAVVQKSKMMALEWDVLGFSAGDNGFCLGFEVGPFLAVGFLVCCCCGCFFSWFGMLKTLFCICFVQ